MSKTEINQDVVNQLIKYRKSIENFEYFKLAEDIVNDLVLSNPMGNAKFYRFLVNSALSYVPASLNSKVQLFGRDPMTSNFYGIALGTSGLGKTSTMSQLENRLLKDFSELIEQLENTTAQIHIKEIARKRNEIEQGVEVYRDDDDPDNNVIFKSSYSALIGEFKLIGKTPTFIKDSTEAALRQTLRRFGMSHVGAVNIVIDEIGSNMAKMQSISNMLLEAYDQGKINSTIRKGDENSKRFPIDYPVPINFTAYGTPNLVLDGAGEEENFHKLLVQGYARRCFFCFEDNHQLVDLSKSIEEERNTLSKTKSTEIYEKIGRYLNSLVNLDNLNKVFKLTEEAELEYLLYDKSCKYYVQEHNLHIEKPILEIEYIHKAPKTLKLASIYAFLNNRGDNKIHVEDLRNAIKFAEDSSNSLTKILETEESYEKIANFFIERAGVVKEVKDIELVKAFGFYKSLRVPEKRELVMQIKQLAYQKGVIVNEEDRALGGKVFVLNKPESVDLNKLLVSCSSSMAQNYVSGTLSLSKFADMLQNREKFNWINHRLVNGNNKQGYRNEEEVIDGFNLLVLDIDNKDPNVTKVSLEEAKAFFKDYHYIMYTTKSHQIDGTDRFRVILPLNQLISLNREDYNTFYKNLTSNLPFNVDQTTQDRCRVWYSNPTGTVIVNSDDNCKLFDAMPYMPGIDANLIEDELSRLRRYFENLGREGNRNNTLAKYAFCLKDKGIKQAQAIREIFKLNSMFDNPLEESEINNTVLKSLKQKYKKDIL